MSIKRDPRTISGPIEGETTIHDNQEWLYTQGEWVAIDDGYRYNKVYELHSKGIHEVGEQRVDIWPREWRD